MLFRVRDTIGNSAATTISYEGRARASGGVTDYSNRARITVSGKCFGLITSLLKLSKKVSEPGGHGSLKGVLCTEERPDCVLNIAIVRCAEWKPLCVASIWSLPQRESGIAIVEPHSLADPHDEAAVRPRRARAPYGRAKPLDRTT